MNKFLSRKFVLAVAAFAAAVSTGNIPLAVGVAVAYLTAEGYIDQKQVGQVADVVDQVTSGARSPVNV